MKVGIPADAAFDYKGGLEEAEEAQELNLWTVDDILAGLMGESKGEYSQAIHR